MSDHADGFQIRTGGDPTEQWDDDERGGHLTAAVEGLRQIRLVTNREEPDPAAVPAEWERRQLLRVVSLLLEAEGIIPSAVDEARAVTRSGYRTSRDQAGHVLVEWMGPRGSGARFQAREQLSRCAAALCKWGFEALEVRGPGNRWYLEVEPPRPQTG